MSVNFLKLESGIGAIFLVEASPPMVDLFSSREGLPALEAFIVAAFAAFVPATFPAVLALFPWARPVWPGAALCPAVLL